MKWNWGTGILIFLILFLMACGGFIWFAFQQDVNLVHRDYYEKGVDYSEQMKVDARSKPFYDAIKTQLTADFLEINFDENLKARIDSGRVLMYRPSNSKNDVTMPLVFSGNHVNVPKENLISGRYILKLFWYSEGLKYQIDKPVNIQ